MTTVSKETLERLSAAMASDDFQQLKRVCEALVFELIDKPKNYVFASFDQPPGGFEDAPYDWRLINNVDINNIESILVTLQPTCHFVLIRGEVVPVTFDNLKLRIDDPYIDSGDFVRAVDFNKWAARRLLSGM